MLYYLFSSCVDESLICNLFRYLTFRSGGAVLTALFICFVIGSPMIRWLKARQHGGQPIREDGPEGHLVTKQGTPTMGGLMILFSMTVSTLLWADLSNLYVWIVLAVTLGYGVLGWVDDYLKVKKRNTKGVRGKMKLVVQFALAMLVFAVLQHVMDPSLSTHLAFPFFKDLLLNMGWFYVVFVSFVIVGSSNAVNLTDGLDGLAIVPIMMAAACLGLIAYLVGHAVFADYLQLHHVKGAGELAIIAMGMIGAGLGFLWFNAPPAKVFMGDTGSLALGGGIGTMSVITKHEIVLGIIGGLFVIEALSVIIQVYYFKLTGGKRFFRMAPIHHHFEKLGWSESTIVVRFWIIAFIFALLGLSTLKLR